MTTEDKDLKQPVAPDRAPAVESVMAIARHPIHPMLVTFPIAFLTTVPLADLAYLLFSDPFWARVGLWLNIGGLGLGVWLRWPDPAAAVWPWGLMQGLVMLGLVMVTGWLGGSLSFHHGIGVYGHTKAEEDPGEDAPPNA